MELPVELQTLIQYGLEIFVTFALTQLAKAGFDFSGYKSQLVAAFFAAVMAIAGALIGKVPADFQNILGVVLQLVVVVLGAFGVHGLYKQIKK